MESKSIPVENPSAITRLMAEAEARDSVLVSRPLYTRYAPGLSPESHRALAVSGLWAGLGFVGASVLAAGLLMLVNGGTGAAVALALTIAGGAVATFCWRSAWKVLAELEPTTAAPAGATSGSGDTSVAQRIAAAHPRTALAGH